MDTDTHAQIVGILDSVEEMSLATLRDDGFPQANVVAFVHDDLRLYLATERMSQKARNIALRDKISATITRPHDRWEDIEGISLGGHATEVTDPDEHRVATSLLRDRFPQFSLLVPDHVADSAVFRVDPVVISLIDYGRGFGFTELVEVEKRLPA